jgi:hypothetical protein
VFAIEQVSEQQGVASFVCMSCAVGLSVVCVVYVLTIRQACCMHAERGGKHCSAVCACALERARCMSSGEEKIKAVILSSKQALMIQTELQFVHKKQCGERE